MDTVEQPSDQQGAASGFFENPKVRLVERILAVLSIPLGVYLTITTQQYRQLDYMINPTKAIVVKSGRSSNLAVSYNGQEVKTDVTAVQIAFWNSGNQPIKRVDILEPLVFKTANATPILEAQLRKRSRDVTGIILDQSQINNGELRINWNIIENNDGGVVQLIVAGDTETPIKIDSIIEGKSPPRMRSDSPPALLYYIFGGALALSIVLSVLVGNGFISLGNRFAEWRESIPGGIVMLFFAALALQAWLFKKPPFGW